jgi:hypothetical protein
MQALALSELVTRTATYVELANLTGYTAQTVATWLKEFRLRKLVHVTSWDGDVRGFATVPRFAWGPGREDAKRPSITAAVLQRQRRQRRKNEA